MCSTCARAHACVPTCDGSSRRLAGGALVSTSYYWQPQPPAAAPVLPTAARRRQTSTSTTTKTHTLFVLTIARARRPGAPICRPPSLHPLLRQVAVRRCAVGRQAVSVVHFVCTSSQPWVDCAVGPLLKCSPSSRASLAARALRRRRRRATAAAPLRWRRLRRAARWRAAPRQSTSELLRLQVRALASCHRGERFAPMPGRREATLHTISLWERVKLSWRHHR